MHPPTSSKYQSQKKNASRFFVFHLNQKQKLPEDYLQKDVVTESNVFNDFIVPEGYLFCMGDNRTKSTDCRRFGCVPFEKIEGIVICRFWPLNKFGSVK